MSVSLVWESKRENGKGCLGKKEIEAERRIEIADSFSLAFTSGILQI